jgi:DNA-binding HxlR family transcriptional regulator
MLMDVLANGHNIRGCDDKTSRRQGFIRERVPMAAFFLHKLELTPKGKALLPVVNEMRRFGHDWLGCGVHET